MDSQVPDSSSSGSAGKTAIPAVLLLLCLIAGHAPAAGTPDTLSLPAPRLEGDFSVERALSGRRSVREYLDAPLELGEISQLLWAAQGITDTLGHRTAPSAGALYPLEIYLAACNVGSLAPAVYRYIPEGHRLVRLMEGDHTGRLAEAAHNQSCVSDCAAVVIICGIPARLADRFGERSGMYTHIEVGSVSQNIYLQAETLGIGTVYVGGFDPDEVSKVLGLPASEHPLCLMPLGRVID